MTTTARPPRPELDRTPSARPEHGPPNPPERPAARGGLRWRLAEHEAVPLFPDETACGRHIGSGAFAGTEFLHVNARSVVNALPAASRLPFRYTVNPYRGCSHACTYCFARPTHAYLGLGTGLDFERRIVVKVNAVERLRAELRAPSWTGEPIAMGTNTDPYQTAEGKYHLTQGIVRTLGEAGNPFSILTKSTLVLRDLRLIAAIARHTDVRLDVSIGTLDRDVWRLTEPGTPPPERRLEVVRRFNEAGVPCGVLIAPVLPGLSDDDEQVLAVARACLDAGAVSLTPVPLHLRPGVREHYLAWLSEVRPDLLGLHRRRFRHGSYQPAEEGARLVALVSSVTGGAGTAGGDRRRRGAGQPEPLVHRPAKTGPAHRPAKTGPAHRPAKTGGDPGHVQLELL